MTPVTLTALTDLDALGVDTVIDVRAPAEYAEDHLPGAINLPVLSDSERAEVGTLYTRHSPFEARKIGGALVAQNTARHLREGLQDKTGAWQPLVYCWRGGQRSGAFATILDQIGWRVRVLKGGYQSYRRLVVSSLYDKPLAHRFTIIDGGTGTAKTALLHALARAGAQTLDLEGLAQHRGSLFGAMPAPQPSQKSFESLLIAALNRLDPALPVYVEAESSKIGARLIPPQVWSAMRAAPRIRIEAPLAARAAFLTRAYADLTADPARVMATLDKLRPYHPATLIADWQELARNGDWTTLAAGLVRDHYDPRYAKSAEAPAQRLTLDDLDTATLDAAARRLSQAQSLADPLPADQ